MRLTKFEKKWFKAWNVKKIDDIVWGQLPSVSRKNYRDEFLNGVDYIILILLTLVYFGGLGYSYYSILSSNLTVLYSVLIMLFFIIHISFIGYIVTNIVLSKFINLIDIFKNIIILFVILWIFLLAVFRKIVWLEFYVWLFVLDTLYILLFFGYLSFRI